MFDVQRAEELEELALLAREAGDEEAELAALEQMDAMRNEVEQQVNKVNQEKGLLGTIGDSVLEGAAAVNRGVAGIADAVTTQPINAALELAGSDSRVSSINSMLAPATTGNFLQDGLAKEIVRAGGEVVPQSLAIGAGLRGAANQLAPAMLSGSEGVAAGSLRQLGSSTAGQDAAFGALSGAGGAAGQELGGDAGALAGAIAAPLSVAAIPAAVNAGRSALANAAEAALTKEAAPTIDALKNTARGVYKEIDDLGAVVNSDRVDGLIRDLNTTIKSEGFNKRIHPKVSAALDEINEANGRNKKVTELDTLRKVARSAAASIEPDEARLGGIMVNKIDDFMDNIDESALVGGQAENVGEKYRHARQLWRRARKAEDIDFIFEKAKNQASGFENGLRTQFRALLNNKNKIRNYTAEEKAAMQKVVRGGGVENTAKALGKFGFTEGQASGMLLGSLGVAGGAAIGGGPGAVAVPLIGQVSKNLAQKLTRNNAELVSQIVRAGKDSTAITKAYINSVPAKERSAYELSELLLKLNAGKDIKYTPKSEKMKAFMSDVGYLVGAANSQENNND